MKILDLFNSIADNIRIPRPYIIAEAGVNHEGSMDLAKRLILEAKEGGADAIKFQTYRANTIASKNSPSYWDLSKEPTTSQFELFKKYDKFWKSEFEQLKRYCDETDIEFMSTPFDIESALFLNDLMDVYKISSSDITNKPFIEYMCSFDKPIILSTGASNLDEISKAVEWIENTGNPLALLHCILNYPTADELANLGMIFSLQKEYPGRLVGYSDHTLPKDMKALEVAMMLGASILEKHFTHDKSLPGNDHYHAMDKEDLKAFCKISERVLTLLGSYNKYALPSEEPAREHARRSLVATRTIPSGNIITKADLTWKRPACGISPCQIDEVIGKKIKLDIVEDEIITLEMLE